MTVCEGIVYNQEIACKYDIDAHIEYVIGVLKKPENEKFGLKSILDLIQHHMADMDFPDFKPEFFAKEFARFLWKLDVIRKPIVEDVYILSDRILAETMRNYRLLDLVEAFSSVRRAYEIQTVYEVYEKESR